VLQILQNVASSKRCEFEPEILFTHDQINCPCGCDFLLEKFAVEMGRDWYFCRMWVWVCLGVGLVRWGLTCYMYSIFSFPFSFAFAFSIFHLNLFIALTKLSTKLHARIRRNVKRWKNNDRRQRENGEGGNAGNTMAKKYQNWLSQFTIYSLQFTVYIHIQQSQKNK